MISRIVRVETIDFSAELSVFKLFFSLFIFDLLGETLSKNKLAVLLTYF
jgi:hypothetical protein